MRKRPSRTYYALFFALLAVLTIPKTGIEKIQEGMVAVGGLLGTATLYAGGGQPLTNNTSIEDLHKLQVENAHLKDEIVRIKNIMQHELGLLNKIESLIEEQDNFSLMPLKRRHRAELEQLLNIQLQAVPSHVIYRSPSTWNSFVWIDVGSAQNERLGISTIAKNSPVVVGTTIVGVIEYVGKQHSKVRLISDPHLSPSVRVARGEKQNHLIRDKISDLIRLLYAEGERFDDHDQLELLINTLQSASSKLHEEQDTFLFAKGILTGSSRPLWRAHTQALVGTGFNYDFTDEAGPARDLRTGEPLGNHASLDGVELVKPGDLLVSTGFDGMFPPNLPVALVTKVHPLKDGDYYYELDAIPAVGDLNELSLVFVIPPLAKDENWE